MAFRTVVIANEAELHVHQGQLVVVQDEQVRIPAEDIAVLVLEHPKIRVSTASLALLAAQGVSTAVCDRKHMPIGIMLPNNQHSRQLIATRRQLEATAPQKKRLWQAIVKSKILNQANCLDQLQAPGARRLREYADTVMSGDTGHVEATAARYYFPRLMPGVGRHSGRGPDPALDYGYAILRAAVARSLAGHGLFAPIGIQHNAQLNQFNLADDVLEPFRPFVDLAAVSGAVDVANIDGRMRMLDVLNFECDMSGKRFSVLTAIEECVVSLTRAFANRDYTMLKVPSIPIGVLNTEDGR